jgi:acylphosphatase
MNDHERARLHATIRGRVQAVGFRQFAYETARRLGLNGWIRNRWDGTVETLVEGPRSSTRAYLEAIRLGPRGAHVDDVETEWQEPNDEFEGFSVRPG